MVAVFFAIWSDFVLHSTARRTLLNWAWIFCRDKNRKRLRGSPLVCVWTLWKERNSRSFKDIEQLDQAIKSVIMSTYLEWVRVYILDLTSTMIRLC